MTSCQWTDKSCTRQTRCRFQTVRSYERFIYDHYFCSLPILFWVTRRSPSDPRLPPPHTTPSAAARLRVLCSGVCILCSGVCKAGDSPRQFVFSPLRSSQIRFTCQMCAGIIRAAPTSDFCLFDVGAVRCWRFLHPHPPPPSPPSGPKHPLYGTVSRDFSFT